MQAITSTSWTQRNITAVALGVLVLALVVTGCGSSASPDPTKPAATVSGVVSSDPAAAGTVTVTDASSPAQQRSSAIANEAFAIDATGLVPPYLVRADTTDANGTAGRMYSLAAADGAADVNPMTDAAVAGASSTVGSVTVEGFRAKLAALEAVLKPLLDLYRVPALPFSDAAAGGAALGAMLRDVDVSVQSPDVVVTNRATGGVIFSGPLNDVASGTFTSAHLPAGPGTPPAPSPPAACTFTYSDWGTCQSNGTQTRTVTGSTPAGCTGTPVLSQACTPPAPAIDGAALYTQMCAGCHGALATSNLKGKNISMTSIKSRNMTQGLTDAQLQAIVTAVGP